MLEARKITHVVHGDVRRERRRPGEEFPWGKKWRRVSYPQLRDGEAGVDCGVVRAFWTPERFRMVSDRRAGT